jgi:hypothetical protein
MNARNTLQPMAEAVQAATMDKIVRTVLLASTVEDGSSGKPSR